ATELSCPPGWAARTSGSSRPRSAAIVARGREARSRRMSRASMRPQATRRPRRRAVPARAPGQCLGSPTPDRAPVGRARATMLDVIPAPAAPRPTESTAFSAASDALQRHRAPSPVWGDEREAVSLALQWAAAHTTVATDPKTTARSAEDLQAQVGETITESGIGAAAAMALFDEVLLPATRASEDPMNLAYIPAAPTRAAVAFDTVVSAANVFGGIWENGAGAIFAENQVLRWIADLLGWPAEAAGVFVSGGTMGNLSALATARDHALRERGARPAGGWALACASTAHSSVASSARLLDMDVVSVPVDDRGHLTGAALEELLAADPRICA